MSCKQVKKNITIFSIYQFRHILKSNNFQNKFFYENVVLLLVIILGYIIKKDEEGNEYSSLLISDNNETIEDLIKLQNIFGGQFIRANVKQENLNKYIKSINFAITKQK